MFDVEHLCSHYILVDSVEVVITYIDICAWLPKGSLVY
jgi:hypothetical protein